MTRLSPAQFELMPRRRARHACGQTLPHRLAQKAARGNTVVKVRGIPIGGEAIQVITGPCSVETPEQMDAAAEAGAPLAAG